VGHCQRCNTVVEPLVSTQWFVKIEPLAKPAIQAVEEGRIRFLPENWTKTYYEWMNNIHDWCISRQLWWGHRIPAWYCDTCGETIVAEQDPTACGCGGPLRQDEDVLDTWFSSQLWPFSTMGWPDETPDLRHYYPTDLMLTAFDIIFFWVARMIMAGLKFTGDVPFREVYITGLVRDERGKKMSKSSGNVVDPLEVMDEIGADALRFTLAAMASPGMDIPLAEGRMTGYRQFINKIWNASRFVLMNTGDVTARPAVPDVSALGLVDRWILDRVSHTAADVDQALRDFRFDVAADRLYHFFWHEYADWYIELIKLHLRPDAPERPHTIAVLLEVHDRILRLLHPIIPFVTEELWQHLPRKAGDPETVTLAAFPTEVPGWDAPAAVVDIDALKEIVTAIRTVRAERGVPPSRKVTAIVDEHDQVRRRTLRDAERYIALLAGLETLEWRGDVDLDADTVKRVLTHADIYVPLAGIVDRQGEVDKLQKELAGVTKEIASLEGKLANGSFVERAPSSLVQQTRDRVEDLQRRRGKLEATLKELAG
jgi:valyl-tRNA synthetase